VAQLQKPVQGPVQEPEAPPSGPVRLPRLGAWGTVRWLWRQLTSMRTALFLLLLLAVAAVPGSVIPQEGIDAGKVTVYEQQHRTLAPLLQRIGAFSVYSSVWFSAIYLLLFVSLVGCLVPRTFQQLSAMRAPLPRTPARPERLPVSAVAEVQPAGPATGVEDQARQVAAVLRRRHYRVAVQEGGRAVAAERGQLRELGNLAFHLSLVGLLLSVAAGHLWGWRGDVIVPVGETTVDAAGAFNTLDAGPWVKTDNLPAFSLHIDGMDVKFQTSGGEAGAPSEFAATVDVRSGSGAARREALSVNHPLSVSGTKVFLLGNGYAPSITVRDSTGRVVYSQTTPFLPQDSEYLSLGVVKATAARPQPLALRGYFLPTASLDASGSPVSVFPDLGNPTLLLSAYEGDLQLATTPSVYQLNTDKMTPLITTSGGPVLILKPGQTVKLAGGKGSVTFNGVQRYAGLTVRHDPGKTGALAFALLAIAGLVLSLSVRRRRVFVRLDPVRPASGDIGSDDPHARRTVVRVAGLARGEDAGLPQEVDAVQAQVVAALEKGTV
jgi:cytochrome c biogenesis protein